MSRAIRKLRGGLSGPPDITIERESLDHIDSSSGNTSTTFTNMEVGSGDGRLIIVFGTARKSGGTSGIFNNVRVDGTSCILRGSARAGNNNENICVIIGFLELTTETGLVDIYMDTGSDDQGSWGMSYVIIKDWEVAGTTDVEQRSKTSDSTVTTFNAMTGQKGGFICGVTAFGNRTAVATWGDLLTKRSEVSTGTNSTKDHLHSVAYDILAADRSAFETVTWNKTNRLAIAMIAVR